MSNENSADLNDIYNLLEKNFTVLTAKLEKLQYTLATRGKMRQAQGLSDETVSMINKQLFGESSTEKSGGNIFILHHPYAKHAHEEIRSRLLSIKQANVEENNNIEEIVRQLDSKFGRDEAKGLDNQSYAKNSDDTARHKLEQILGALNNLISSATQEA